MREHIPPDSIDEYTASVTQIDMYFNDTYISSATGFFWRNGERSYLVTNWHNVTGIDPSNGKHISESTAAEPTHVEFGAFHTSLSSRKRVRASLYNGEHPAWLEHPINRRAVDVVCIELIDMQYTIFPINDCQSELIRPHVGQDVFVIGYPRKIGVQGFALWKRASIASQPLLDVGGLPLVFIDTATTKGMSGSPVVIRTTQGTLESGQHHIWTPFATRFFGVYSGRLSGESDLEAQLGRVWKLDVVQQIIDGQILGAKLY